MGGVFPVFGEIPLYVLLVYCIHFQDIVVTAEYLC